MFEIRKTRTVAQGRRRLTREWEDTGLRLRAPRHGCPAFAAAVRFPGCGLA
jgi:hypothetical protein